MTYITSLLNYKKAILFSFAFLACQSIFAQTANPFDGNGVFEILGQSPDSPRMQDLKSYLSEDPDTKFTDVLWFSRVKGLEIGFSEEKVVRLFVHGKSPYNYGTEPFKGTYLLGIEHTDAKTQIISQLGRPYEEKANSYLLYYVKHGDLVYYTKIELNDDEQSIKHTYIKIDEEKHQPTITSQYHTGQTASAGNNATTAQGNLDDSKKAGCVEGNCYEGPSTYIWESGSKYIGEYSKGKRTGFGIYFFANGDKYIGEWNDNQRHGTGTYIYATKGQYQKYIGDWNNGKRSGIGMMEYKNGDQKLGEWEENDFIEGDEEGCISGDCENTYSDYIWENHSRYIGNFRASVPHGKGTMYYLNGAKYAGNFQDGKPNGQGTYYATDGSRYEGEWNMGIKHGFGIMYLTNGEVNRGEWKDGEFVP